MSFQNSMRDKNPQPSQLGKNWNRFTKPGTQIIDEWEKLTPFERDETSLLYDELARRQQNVKKT